ncbi:M50 family metallopeptidase [Paenibacillus sacheonensis]|uniref:Zn-dependent protease n=1 Tax=Paenibacillus sacheonensis TaxID=742054 RepID=A0A7X5BUZ0_9BACL|nr:M50 family metallopeptidase [Paenibacillus sacheonensis]MBM7563770.1 stage IV sporulation protein FB [Paenibacillus sacheonensis]NBC67878.1 Zn-dependent protease [Paenibacillus sacheonensis]
MIKLGGIRWSVHPLFVLIMLASVLTGYFVELLTLFAIVLVHELGHVIAARGFGWTVREVKLLPFGGVAEVEDGSGLPAREEALVAIAGPLQNAWMAGAAWLLGQLGLWQHDWAAYVCQANLMIGLFNLLPILPLDGGKLMQAGLSRTLTFHGTLVWGTRISLLFSALMIVCAVVPAVLSGNAVHLHLNLIAVGLFLLLTNWTAYRNIPFLFLRFLTNRALSSTRAVSRGTLAFPIIVPKGYTVLAALRLFKRDSYHLIVVMEEKGDILAVLPEQRLVSGFLSDGKADRAVLELFM